MTDPRNPLITGVTNVAGYRGDDKLPTSYAVNQLFSGESLGTNVRANSLTKSGTYRFNATTKDLPSHLDGTSGLLTVMHERPSAPSNANYGSAAATTDYTPTVVRQIAWPDGPSDVTPYTRTYQSGTWGEWQTMGGNLRRVALTANTTALTNVMYYSFGAYTLTLPNPAEYPLATRIGLEQWAGQGSVVSADGNTTQATSPAYETNENGEPTNVNLGPQVYTFEIVADSNGDHTWVMDIDNNIAKTIQGIHNRISNVELNALDRTRELDERIGNGFVAPYRAWQNGNTTIYTKSSMPKAGDTYYTNRTAETVGGTITAVTRNESTQLVESVTVGSTVYERTAASDNSENTVTAKHNKEVDDREDGDTKLSNRLGSGVTASNTATSQFNTINTKLGNKITTTDTVSALFGNKVTNSTTGVLGTSGTVSAQFEKANTLLGTGVNETSHNNQVANLGTYGTVTSQLSLVKSLFGSLVTTATTGSLGSSGSVTAQLQNAKALLGENITTDAYNASTTVLGTRGTATAQFTLTGALFGSGVTTAAYNASTTKLGSVGTVTAQATLVKNILGLDTTNRSVVLSTNNTVTSVLANLNDRLETGVTTDAYNASTTALGTKGTATAQFTLTKNLLGTGVTNTTAANLGTAGTVTSQFALTKAMFGTANVVGESAPISSAAGKSVAELISNKEPRTKLFTISSNIGVSTTLKDANDRDYTFQDLLNRIHPTFVVVGSCNVTLPAATNYAIGTKCTIEVLANKYVNVYDAGVSATDYEQFSNAAGNPILVLPFEVSNDGTKNIWTLLVIA